MAVSPRPDGRQPVLLTGFGPFPNMPANATAHLVPRIAREASSELGGIAVHWHVLPTEWQAAPRLLGELVRDTAPRVILHFGVSSQAQGFVVEARGRNAVDPIQDAAGCLPEGGCVHPAGPDVLAATLRPGYLVSRLRRRGHPAIVSRDAGGYLCNALLYTSLALAGERDGAMWDGFVHLPASLAHAAGPTRGPAPCCPLDWDDVVDGGVELIAAALGRPPRPLSRRPHSRHPRMAGAASLPRNRLSTST